MKFPARIVFIILFTLVIVDVGIDKVSGLFSEESLLKHPLTGSLILAGIIAIELYFLVILPVVNYISEQRAVRDALRESEENNRTFLDELVEGFCIIEMVFDERGNPVDYRFLEVNKIFESMTGLHDAKGKLMRELEPELEFYWFETYARIARTGIPEHFQNEANALGRYYDVHAYRSGGPGSKKVAVLFNDITRHKKYEEELQQSEELFSIAFQNSPVAYAITQRPDNVFMDVNAAFLDLFELSREEVIGCTAAELRILPDAEEARRIALIFKETGILRDYETDMQTKSGKKKRVLISSQKVKIRGKKHFLSTITDITDRKQVEKELQESEQRWETTLDSIGDAVVATCPKGNITFMNPLAECLTGWTLDEAKNKHVTQVVEIVNERTGNKENIVHQVINEDTRLKAGHRSILYSKGGSEIAVEESGAPIKTKDGKKAGMVLVLRDITERKKAEERLKNYNHDLEEMVTARTSELNSAMIRAESADRIKSIFLLTMSHELRTPLNSIIGFSGVLLQELPGKLNEEQRTQLKMIQKSGRKLLTIITDILDMSRIESGELEINYESFDLQKVIEEVIEAEVQYYQEKDLSMIFTKDYEIIEIESDKTRVRQVLMNIVHNAVKFTEKGQVKISCSVEKGTVKVGVSDTGPGIEKEKIDELFVPFIQVDNDLIRRNPSAGSGLGLAISKRLLDLLDGQITVESKPGKGSTFTVIMPLQRTRA